jgi:hypothetical protein
LLTVVQVGVGLIEGVDTPFDQRERRCLQVAVNHSQARGIEWPSGAVVNREQYTAAVVALAGISIGDLHKPLQGVWPLFIEAGARFIDLFLVSKQCFQGFMVALAQALAESF